MIICHEGLPRSGKSYEAMVKHVLPALKKGRKVFAYIEGINHEKIAEILEMTVEAVKELLIEVKAEDVPKIFKIAEKNSLIIIDEIHKFWPNQRNKMDQETLNWIAEHGHDGQDIIVMTQTYDGSTHREWRNRTQRKIQFLKLDVLGREKKFQWTGYTGLLDAKGNIKWQKVDNGFGSYDEKYFGIYKSHTSDEVQTGNYKDQRFNALNQKSLKFGIPFAVAAFIGGLWYTIHFLSTPDVVVKNEKPNTTQTPGKTPGQKTDNSQSQNTAASANDSAELRRLKAENDKLKEEIEKKKQDIQGTFEPRNVGHPETAPAYDGIRNVTAIPINRGCYMLTNDPMSCKCITDQGSAITGISIPSCVAQARGRYDFNPYAGEIASNKVATPDMATTASTGQGAVK